MNGYANIDIISHSWGTTLAYDLMNNSGIEVHDWVTMGSPLKHDTQKPVGNTGNWFNYYSQKDPVMHYEIYPPFPSFGEMRNAVLKDVLGGPGLSRNPNILPGNQREYPMGQISFFEHIAYWNDEHVLNTLREDLQ